MKKSLYFACAASLLFAACDEDYKDWADPQSSSEGDPSAIEGAISTPSTIDGATATGDVTLLNLNAPEGCSISATHLYVNGDNELDFTLDGSKITVDAQTLSNTVRSLYNSMAPVQRELTISGNFSMVNANGEASPLSLDPVTVDYMPAPLPANASEKKFWYIGGHNSWDLSTANADSLKDNGDGTYSITLSIGDGEWFAFAPQSAVEAGDWNALFRAPSNGCTDTEGFLDSDPTTGYSFNCENGGQYTFILDMNNYTYKYVHYIEKQYYYIGALSTKMDYPLSNGGMDPMENPVFTATIPAYGVDNWHWFKIAPASGFNADSTFNWDNEQYCACATTKDDEGMSGKFVIGGDKYSWHLVESANPAKFYRLSFNFLTQEYSITPINYTEYIYYAGDWTSWGDGKKELALTDTEKGIYTGYYFIKAVDNSTTWGFKFIDADGNWYGGGNGLLNGDSNCDPGEEGFYKITVDWANMTYELTKIETISFVGDVTGDSSWGTDVDLTWNGECWTYTGPLSAGSFKFRANKAWNGINWGGDATNLEIDGANASIATAGTYTVKLYCNCPGKAYYTIE